MKNSNARAWAIAAMLSLGCSAPVLAAPTVYIPLGTADQIVAVDAATSRIVASYPGVANPHGLVATPDGEYLVAGSLLEKAAPAGVPNSILYLVHPGHGHVMLTIPVAGWTHHEAITPDGRYVISTHPTRGSVSVVDLQTNQVLNVIATGPAPNYAVVTHDGRRAYVSNSGNATLSVIDLRSWRVVRTLEGGPAPEHLVLSPDERTLYALNPRAGTVSAISVESGKAVRSYHVGSTLHGLDIGDDGQTLFVSSVTDNKLVALDPGSGAQRAITLSPAPYHLNVIHGTGKVYVSSRSAPVVWVVDQKSLRLEGAIDLPAGVGHQMAIIP